MWTNLYRELPDRDAFLTKDLIQSAAEAGNSEILAEKLEKIKVSSEDKVDTFLHVYAQKHSLKHLFEQISEKSNDLNEFLKKKNKNGYNFLAVAVDGIEDDTEKEKDIIEAMEQMDKVCGEDTVSLLCQESDKGGNNLLHLAVRKSLTHLMRHVLDNTSIAATPNQETPNQQTPNQQTPNQQTPNQETPNQQTANQ